MTFKFGRHIFGILLLLGLGVSAFAQGGRIIIVPQQGFRNPNFNGRPRYYRPQNNPQFQQNPAVRKVQGIKENFISKQLMLSPEQTYRFLAVYRQYQQDTRNVRFLKRQNNSDATANGAEQLNKDLAYEHQLADIKDHYTAEFLKIMPPEKVSVIFKSEREFNDEAVRHIQESMKAGPPPGR